MTRKRNIVENLEPADADQWEDWIEYLDYFEYDLDVEELKKLIVKFGLNNEIVSLTSVSFIADIGVTAETLWDSWPKATS